MKSLIVSKFGGTSMGTLESMRQAAQIVAKKPAIRVVVVSATSGTTNQLLKIAELAKSELQAGLVGEIAALKSRHRELAIGLNGNDGLMNVLSALEYEFDLCVTGLNGSGEISAEKLDTLLAFGERWSSLLFTQALCNERGLQAEQIDARQFLKTDSHFGKAEPNPAESAQQCQSLRKKIDQDQTVYVTQGFIGSDDQGRTTTLGRGGSDYSAALFAEALQASELEIWTDVAGILTMDPRVVPTAKVIREISFAEAAEMANFGAKVLHPATLWPAVRARIPVFVGSTFAPDEAGTRILPESANAAPLIRAIAVRKQQTLITVSSLRMLNTPGFLAKMFEVLARHRLSIDLVTTSEVSVALTVDETSLGSNGIKVKAHTEMLNELRAFADVKIEEDLSLIAIIGNALDHSSGVAAKVFHAISEVNVRLICHGASEHNICFLVASSEAAEVAKRLHHVCIEWTSR